MKPFRMLWLSAAVLPLQYCAVKAQTTFYDLSAIQKIEIHFSQSNWDYILDTAKAGSGSYLMAEWVKVNGTLFDSVGVKYKGTSSYDSSYHKNPFHIALDKFKSQNYQGLTSFKLANGYGDPSMIREVLSYGILGNYMDCPRSNFAQVYVNDAYIGLYSNDENIGKTFVSGHFYSSSNTFVKCSPEVAGPYSKSNLKYINADSSSYFNLYEMESDYGWNDLVNLCDHVTNYQSTLSSYMDMDRVIWMLAFDNVMVNLDSYLGWFSQNHYLYKDNTGHFNSIVWDLNMSFGGFPFAGAPGGGSGSLTVANMQQLPPTLHATHTDWPLVNAVLNDAMYKRMFIAHMKTIHSEMFSSGWYQNTAAQLQALIDTAVQSDVNKFFTYNQFQNGLSANTVIGSYTVPGISTLMSARSTYLAATTEFTAVAPVISVVASSSQSPVINSQVIVTATVTGASSGGVYLGNRFSKTNKFVREQMYDDGNHGDGAANDNVYGAIFTMAGLEAQYYVYAENSNSGIFSPSRAEHEFYSLTATIQTAQPGEVVINEFLAKNANDTVNEQGSHEDWIELYNTTSNPLNLYGLYLTDDYTAPAKFAFPDSTFIQPHAFLMVWADEQSSTAMYVHSNFKLSANGEQLMLSNGAGLVLDSLTFGAQTADISMGRCPNATGAFAYLTDPTFGETNDCPVGIEEHGIPVASCRVFPNPAGEEVTILLSENNSGYVNLFHSSGLLVKSVPLVNGKSVIRVAEYPAGIYLYRVKDLNGNLLNAGKLLVR